MKHVIDQAVNKRVIRFLVSGGVAAICEYIAYMLLHVILGETFIIASQSLSFCIGLVISFILNKYWVFTSVNDISHEFFRYTILAIINLILSGTLIYLLVEKVSLDWRLAKIIVMACVAGWNYLLFQKLIFRTKED